MSITSAMTEVGRVLMGVEHPHAMLRARLFQAMSMSVLVAAIGTVLIYLAERHARGTQIDDLGDALFWTTTQMTTVSSQMVNPLTTPGRVIDVVIQIYAVVVVVSLAGTFASFFTHREREQRRRDGIEG